MQKFRTGYFRIFTGASGRARFLQFFPEGGVTLNMLALAVVLLGTLLTVVASYATGVSLPDMVGILCGATTNTPALGAAQQTLKQMGIESSTPALGCAVAIRWE